MMKITFRKSFWLRILYCIANLKLKIQSKLFLTSFRNVYQMVHLIWPNLSIFSKRRILYCFILLAIGRVFGFLTPLLSQYTADTLLLCISSKSGHDFPYRVIILAVVVAFGQKLTEIAHSLIWTGVEQENRKLINDRFLGTLYNLDMKWHLNNKPGNILKVMELGSDGFNSIIDHVFFCLLPNLLDILIAFLHLQAIFNKWLLIGVSSGLVFMIATTQMLMTWRKQLLKEVHKCDKKQSQLLIDTLLNIENVKCFNGENYEIRRFMKLFNEFQNYEKKAEFTRIWLDFSQSFLMHSSVLYGSLLVAYSIYSGNLGFGYYLLFLTYMNQIRGLLRYFFEYIRTINTGLVQLESLMEVLELKISKPANLESSSIIENDSNPGLAIQFDNVKFSFDEETEVLRGISFNITAGACIGITGPSGQGKSTILKLLLRLWTSTSGTIKVNNKVIEEYSLSELRRLISIVPQDTILFNDTIISNITYGNEDLNGIDVNEVHFAAEKAVLSKDILSFSNGYDTSVGERGLCLSGGQRLRICIARCIYRNSQIILLDEPTSSLDKPTEAKIIQNINDIFKGKTKIIISHNLNVISNCDQIHVLNSGQIVQSGTHLELIKQNGLYKDMWACQYQEDKCKNN